MVKNCRDVLKGGHDVLKSGRHLLIRVTVTMKIKIKLLDGRTIPALESV